MPSSDQTHLAVVGGGLLGLATAYRFIARFPGLKVTVLEKESSVCSHQSGNNSGVIHSGVYYKPGSLKARLSTTGRKDLLAFCEQEGVPFNMSGKVIVATNDDEHETLKLLSERAAANGVLARLLTAEELREREPECVGIAALHVKDAGVVDYKKVGSALAAAVEKGGGEVRTSFKVTSIVRQGKEFCVRSDSGESVNARFVVSCGGLHSDRIARMCGAKVPASIVPFRGEYYKLRPESRDLCRSIIYPVPDQRFPFLGVHLTRGVSGEVECGPNAVLAMSREGYTWRDFDCDDVIEAWFCSGLPKFALRHWRMGLFEMWRSLSKKAFVAALQRLVPRVTEDDVIPAFSGVRAQAMRPDGTLLDDFLLVDGPGSIHVVNAPSPAATSSLALGDEIVEALVKQFA